MFRRSPCALSRWLRLAQVYVPGPQVFTFLSDVDDTDQPYGLYLPKQYDPQKKYPLVISLHGAYSNHRLNLRRVFGKGNRIGETDAEATRYWPQLRDVDFIVASPLARGTMGYKGIAEKDVYDVLGDVKRRFSVDEDRIYLRGSRWVAAGRCGSASPVRICGQPSHPFALRFRPERRPGCECSERSL